MGEKTPLTNKEAFDRWLARQKDPESLTGVVAFQGGKLVAKGLIRAEVYKKASKFKLPSWQIPPEGYQPLEYFDLGTRYTEPE